MQEKRKNLKKMKAQITLQALHLSNFTIRHAYNPR